MHLNFQKVCNFLLQFRIIFAVNKRSAIFYYYFWRIYAFSHLEKYKGTATYATVPFRLSLLLQKFLFFQIHSQQLRYLIHQLQAIFQMFTCIKLVRHQITAGTGAEFLGKALMKFQR